MGISFSTILRPFTVLLVGALVVSGCSGSSTGEAPEPGDTTTGNSGADNVPEGFEPGENSQMEDPSVPSMPSGNPTASDPLAQNMTSVNFNIVVPAYVSDALQVRLVWGDTDMTAEWVGDELWSVVVSLPFSTENPLQITFYDRNGAITLGRYEQPFKTGANESEMLSISADQFDTEAWDSDGDGTSNINELKAGTDPFEFLQVLLFSETQGYRHPSIPDALVALEELAASSGMQTVRAGDSQGIFTDENLANYDAVVWALTSGDVLDSDEQAAFENFIRSGGGFMGIHAASDTEYDWPWYGSLVGAYFDSHPDIQSARQEVEDTSHVSTAHLGSTWTRTDEWYDYSVNPRAQVNVLLRLDEESYTGGGMGVDHPSAWYHNYDGGRSWYTGGGHTSESYAEPKFRLHLLGGLQYAVGRGL